MEVEMPKVTEEYIQNKKKMIVDAAYQLCLEKTVSTVTMQDIINKTGLSQGGIYRFYRDIDEIFRDMLMELRKHANLKEKIDEIFSRSENLETEEMVNQIFGLLAEFMSKELMGIEKVDFELSVLAMNAPQRVEKILDEIEEVGNKEYLMLRTSQHFKQKIKEGKLHPRVSGEELLTFITASYTGIQMSCIVNCCYKQMPMGQWYDPKIQFMTLAKTVNYLLGSE